jgi:hypothetical protein
MLLVAVFVFCLRDSAAHGGILNAQMTRDLVEALYCMRQRCSPKVCHGLDHQAETQREPERGRNRIYPFIRSARRESAARS